MVTKGEDIQVPLHTAFAKKGILASHGLMAFESPGVEEQYPSEPVCTPANMNSWARMGLSGWESVRPVQSLWFYT